jgi:hypothetical protein
MACVQWCRGGGGGGVRRRALLRGREGKEAPSSICRGCKLAGRRYHLGQASGRAEWRVASVIDGVRPVASSDGGAASRQGGKGVGVRIGASWQGVKGVVGVGSGRRGDVD